MRAKLKQLLNHERYQFLALSISLILLGWVSCIPSQVNSLTKPGTKITRQELEAEINAFLALAEARYTELDRQDKVKQLIAEKALLFSQTGVINPQGIITLIVSILGIGAIADNTRKRLELKRLTGKPLLSQDKKVKRTAKKTAPD